MSHISEVQTLVKASGKKSRTVFVLPKLLLSFTSTRPLACFDLSVKSGALDPTGIAIIQILVFSFQTRRYRQAAPHCQRDTGPPPFKRISATEECLAKHEWGD